MYSLKRRKENRKEETMSKKKHTSSFDKNQINQLIDYLQDNFDSPLEAISVCMVTIDILQTALGIKIHEDTIKLETNEEKKNLNLH